MKSRFFTAALAAAIAMVATVCLPHSAMAQSSLPRAIISGNQFCTYGNSGAQVCIPIDKRNAPMAKPKRARR
jgi:hypothetical protein